ADRGPGIPLEERTHVLKRFYRIERSRSTPGSGLGLSLVAVVARLHDAHLEMEDNAPGLKIQLRFPLADSHPAASPPHRPELSQPLWAVARCVRSFSPRPHLQRRPFPPAWIPIVRGCFR